MRNQLTLSYKLYADLPVHRSVAPSHKYNLINFTLISYQAIVEMLGRYMCVVKEAILI